MVGSFSEWSGILQLRVYIYSNLEYVKGDLVKEKLTTTSYAVLAQVAVRPWSAYELAQQRVRYFRYTWPAAESAIYREVKRLAKMGLIVGTKEYTGKRARTIYAISDTGTETLQEWLGTPVSPFSMDFEAMLRVFVAPLGTKEELIGTLEQVLADARDMLDFASNVKQEFIDGINVTQDQVYIRAIAVDFFTSHVLTVAEWAERSIEEVAQWDDLEPTEEKNKRGLERIRQTPVTSIGHALTGVATPPPSQMRTPPTRT
jgi:PadR family transcriptional regulator AphA